MKGRERGGSKHSILILPKARPNSNPRPPQVAVTVSSRGHWMESKGEELEGEGEELEGEGESEATV